MYNTPFFEFQVQVGNNLTKRSWQYLSLDEKKLAASMVGSNVAFLEMMNHNLTTMFQSLAYATKQTRESDLSELHLAFQKLERGY